MTTSTSAMSRAAIEQTVAAALGTLSGTPRAVSPSQDLQHDLGLDSIELVELASETAKQLGAPNVRVDLAGVVTVRDLAVRLEECLGSTVR